MSPTCHVVDLRKGYPSGERRIEVLRGVELVAEAGDTLAIIGPSGSGKSTLLNILGGLDRPTGGQVLFEGEDLGQRSEAGLTRYRRKHVGFIFQFYNLVPSLTARENVALVTEIARDPIPPEDALAMVGLGERIDHFPAELSGGEQQRVAVARAIAKRPELLFCDEPTGALDSETGVRVLEALDHVNRELGATTVIITHNIGIAGMSDRTIRLSDGRIVSEEDVGRAKKPSELSW